MKRPPKTKEINRKLSKKSRNKKSKISKKKRITSSSLNKKNTNLEPRNQEKILLIIKRYFVNESQDRLKKIL